MRCPFCKEDNDKVIDSRSSEGGRIIRRRRECLECSRRFTTYEKIGEASKLNVVKKDGTRVPYDRDKLIAGLQKACYKRPISVQQILELAEDVEEQIFKENVREVSSEYIGQETMRRLRSLDKVAYVRYASVYHEFQDLGQFISEVRDVMDSPDDGPDQGRLFTG